MASAVLHFTLRRNWSAAAGRSSMFVAYALYLHELILGCFVQLLKAGRIGERCSWCGGSTGSWCRAKSTKRRRSRRWGGAAAKAEGRCAGWRCGRGTATKRKCGWACGGWGAAKAKGGRAACGRGTKSRRAAKGKAAAAWRACGCTKRSRAARRSTKRECHVLGRRSTR